MLFGYEGENKTDYGFRRWWLVGFEWKGFGGEAVAGEVTGEGCGFEDGWAA